jgi:hypothetical protein
MRLAPRSEFVGRLRAMTSPVEEILVRCRRCGRLYRDWFRASVNPQLNAALAADQEYVEAASTATCPSCHTAVAISDLERGHARLASQEPGGLRGWRKLGGEPPRQLRVASLNLRATPNRRATTLAPLIELLGRQEPDVVLLQECRTGWTERVCRELGLDGFDTHELLAGIAGLPADGCAVAVRPPLRIMNTVPIAPEMFMPPVIEALIGSDTPPGYERLPEQLLVRFRARSLIARITDGLYQFAAASFHATPGTGRFGPKPGKIVGNWKPFFHGGVAAALTALTYPFVFAIDANEPRSETLDSVTFHWRDGRPGARKFGALLGLHPVHRGRDLLREQIRMQGLSPAAGDYLALTYTTRGGGVAGGRRFDSIWATRDFLRGAFSTHYEDALAAGTDHAMLVADLELGPPD